MSPELPRKWFLQQGQAIEARYKRCHAWWEPHLVNSRDFIVRNLPESSSVAVLGAGKLLDIELDIVLSRCKVVHLFDADAGALKYCRKRFGKIYGDRLVYRHVDLTECLDIWIKGLSKSIKKSLVNYLSNLYAPAPLWADESFDGYISLNILGQIPLYWRDRVFALKSDLSLAEWGALSLSMGRLQEAHLRALNKNKDMWSILLTDTEYYFYHVDQSDWRVEPALFGAAVDIYNKEYANLPGREAWLWHIAPQFIESDEEGEIHRVEARAKIP